MTRRATRKPSPAPAASRDVTTPGDLASERALLGVLLMGGQDTAWRAAARLEPNHFSSSAHQTIFAAACALRDSGQDPDLVTVVTELRNAGTLGECGQATYLSSLSDDGGHARSAPTYVTRILKAYRARRLQGLGADLVKSLGNGHPESAEGILKRITEAASVPTGTKPALTPIDLSVDPEPVRWLVRSLVPLGGSTILAAASNTGKSWLALDLALCVATGEPFLSQDDFRVAHNDGPVIVVEEESPPGAIHWRLAALARARGYDLKDSAIGDRLTAFASQGVRPSNVSTWAALTDLAHRLQPSLITLDPASSMLDGADTDPEFVAPFLNAVRTLRRDVGCSILIVHHAGWAAKDRVRGWSGWRDSADAEINLVAGSSPNTPTLSWSKVRDGRRPDPLDLYLNYDDDSRSMTLEIAGRHTPARPSGQELDLALWAWVRARGGSKADRDAILTWGHQQGVSRATTDRSIARLKSAGKLVYDGRSFEAVG